MVHIDRIHGTRGVRMICEPNVRDGVSKGYGAGKGRSNCRILQHNKVVSQLKSRPQSRHRNDT